MSTIRKIRIVLLLFVAALMLLLVMQNTAPVEARFLWMSAEIPVVTLLGATSIGGFVTGSIATLLLTKRKSRSDA